MAPVNLVPVATRRSRHRPRERSGLVEAGRWCSLDRLLPTARPGIGSFQPCEPGRVGDALGHYRDDCDVPRTGNNVPIRNVPACLAQKGS